MPVTDTQPITLKPERRAELEAYAQLHGQTPAEALDDLLAAQLTWEKREYREAVAGIKRGYEDVKAGRTQPAKVFLEELRVDHGFPR